MGTCERNSFKISSQQTVLFACGFFLPCSLMKLYNTSSNMACSAVAVNPFLVVDSMAEIHGQKTERRLILIFFLFPLFLQSKQNYNVIHCDGKNEIPCIQVP